MAQQLHQSQSEDGLPLHRSQTLVHQPLPNRHFHQPTGQPQLCQPLPQQQYDNCFRMDAAQSQRVFEQPIQHHAEILVPSRRAYQPEFHGVANPQIDLQTNHREQMFVPPQVPIQQTTMVAEPTVLQSQQIAARQVVGKQLPRFDGNPMDWPMFISSYEQSTAACGYTNAEKF